MRIKITRVIEALTYIERQMALTELREADNRGFTSLDVAAFELEYGPGMLRAHHWRRLNRQREACQDILNEYLGGMEFERGY